MSGKTFLVGMTILAVGIVIAAVGTAWVNGYFAQKTLETMQQGVAQALPGDQGKLDMTLPDLAEGQAQEQPAQENAVEEKPEAVEIFLGENGQIQMGGKPVSMEKFSEALKQTPEAPIVFRVHENVEHEKVTELLNLCARAGVTNVAFSADTAEPPLEH